MVSKDNISALLLGRAQGHVEDAGSSPAEKKFLREPMNTEGPTVDVVNLTLSCAACKHCNAELLKSGKYPDWEYHCTHPLGDKYTGGWIGCLPETPKWCPLTKENLDRSSTPFDDGSEADKRRVQ